jgi:D-arginine dehydrogenase
MKTSDVVIIGGGIAGVSLAARLAPSMRVVLLEAEASAGFHATGRSAAVFVPNYGDGPVRELTRISRSFFDAPDPDVFPHPLLAKRGLLRLVLTEGEQAYSAAMGGAAGIEPISLLEAERLFPLLEPKRFAAASLEADVHDIDVDAMLQGFARQARRAGADIVLEQRVDAIEPNSEGWIVRVHGERYATPVIVNAAGAWADAIAALAGLPPLGVRPCRRSVAILPLPEVLATELRPPFVVSFPLRWFAKADAARLLISTAEEEEVEPHDAFADEMTLAEGLHRFEEDTRLTVTRLEGSWAGLRTFRPPLR